MSLEPQDITIAVTVYNRRDYLRQSIASALEQSIPVRVIVVEDCGPDPGIQGYVHELFGDRVQYFRSSRRRGIFGNWNACIEQCQTPWLSILHDDDWLQPGFVQAMIELEAHAGTKGLYFGRTTVVDSKGHPCPHWEKPHLSQPWVPVSLGDVLFLSPFSFPGQLFQVQRAKQQGCFRETSQFTGEWELWAKLIAYYGGAQTDTPVAVFRDHRGQDRGTTRIYQRGKTFGLTAVQCKRNVSLAKKIGFLPPSSPRYLGLSRPPVPTMYMLYYAKHFSRLYLAYNTRRFTRCPPPNWRYGVVQWTFRLGGPRFVRLASKLWTAISGDHGFTPEYVAPPPWSGGNPP